MATKCKGLLCFLVLLFFLTGFTFTSNYSHSAVLGRTTSPYHSSQSALSAQPLTLPPVAASAPDQHEASSAVQHPSDQMIGAASEGTLFYPAIHKQLFTRALLPVIARALGLSTLVLRE